MKVIGQIIALLFLVALFGAIGTGAYFAFEYVAVLFASLDRQVAIVMGVACVALLAASWVIAHSIRTATRQSKATAFREERTATYQLFVDYWEGLIRQIPAQADQLPSELSEKLKVLERLLALYGGAAVLKAHTSLRSMANDKGALHPDVRVRFSEALVAIRKDLGSDTPRNIASELERLLLPVIDAMSEPAESSDKRGHEVAARTS